MQAEIDRLKSKNERMKQQLRDAQNFVTNTKNSANKLDFKVD